MQSITMPPAETTTSTTAPINERNNLVFRIRRTSIRNLKLVNYPYLKQALNLSSRKEVRVFLVKQEMKVIARKWKLVAYRNIVCKRKLVA